MLLLYEDDIWFRVLFFEFLLILKVSGYGFTFVESGFIFNEKRGRLVELILK